MCFFAKIQNTEEAIWISLFSVHVPLCYFFVFRCLLTNQAFISVYLSFLRPYMHSLIWTTPLLILFTVSTQNQPPDQTKYHCHFSWYIYCLLEYIKKSFKCFVVMGSSNEFMGKTFQAAQLTHESFDHRSLLQSIFLISTKLNFHTRGPWKFSLAAIKQKYFAGVIYGQISLMR